MTYFEAFGIEPKLQLDLDDLQQRFYRLSREFHPDRFSRKSAAEQQAAVDRTALLNDGIRVLKDPVRRAEYILKHHGFDIGEQRSKDVPPELLEEVFELNEALEDSDRAQLTAFETRFRQMLAASDADLQTRFAAWDASQSRDELAAIRAILNRRRYIENLIAKIQASASAS